MLANQPRCHYALDLLGVGCPNTNVPHKIIDMLEPEGVSNSWHEQFLKSNAFYTLEQWL